MEESKRSQKYKNFYFVVVLVLSFFLIILFNYFVDPFDIFKTKTFKGVNNIKIYKLTNKRSAIWTDMKLNGKGKKVVFTGNCLLSYGAEEMEDVAFFNLTVAKVHEVLELFKVIPEVAPDVKKVYVGMFFDDFWETKNDEVQDVLKPYNKYYSVDDFVNYLFSYNTTKYSVDTLLKSIEQKGEDIVYVYPYRELVDVHYKDSYNKSSFDDLEKMVKIAKKNNIEIVFYYSPIHVSKKVSIYEKGLWDVNNEIKRKLAKIAPFYDYSISNNYNQDDLDENSKYFVDSLHPTKKLQEEIVKELVSDDEKIGVLVTEKNVDEILDKDTNHLKRYMKQHPATVQKISNLKAEDKKVKIRQKNVI